MYLSFCTYVCTYVCLLTADGRSFWLNDPRQLEAVVLPRYFKHHRVAFFVKQLRAYGFLRA